jgi:2-keto-3-deoxy-6-phosphogluconate aldolase
MYTLVASPRPWSRLPSNRIFYEIGYRHVSAGASMVREDNAKKGDWSAITDIAQQ